MSSDERQSPASDQVAARPPAATRSCPFCGAPAAAAQFCGSCGRNTNAPRRPCGSCGRMSPSSERACWHCGANFKSDMRWKVPLIVFLFLLAFVLSIVVALLK